MFQWPKQKSSFRINRFSVFVIGILKLEFVSDFDIRISDFELSNKNLYVAVPKKFGSKVIIDKYPHHKDSCRPPHSNMRFGIPFLPGRLRSA